MDAQMQMQIPVFTGEDHEIWSIKMKTLLMSRDLWDVVESGLVSEENQCQKDLKIKDMTALHMLQMSVTDSIFFRIARATSSKQAWELLKADFGESKEIRWVKERYLDTKFHEMVMKEEESVWDYINKLMGLVNQLRFYGCNTSDKEVIHKIFKSLPSRFDEIVRLIRCEKFTITQIAYFLREHECRSDGSEKKEEAPHNQRTSECYTNIKRGRR